MRQTITISLPSDVKRALDATSREEGVSRSDVVRESLRDYLFGRRLRTLRARILPKAARKGIHTDEDVFDRVS